MFRVIIGMAESKKDVEYTLSSMTYRTIEHLFKVYMMPKSTAVDHWKNEIYNFIHSVSKLKNSGKYPSSKQIYSWTLGKHLDVLEPTRIKVMIENLEFKYNYDSSSVNVFQLTEDFVSFIQEYFSWLSDMLSKFGAVSYRDVYTKIDFMISSF